MLTTELTEADIISGSEWREGSRMTDDGAK